MSDTIIQGGSSVPPKPTPPPTPNKTRMPAPRRKRLILKGLSANQREALISAGYMTAGVAAGLGLSSMFSMAKAEPDPTPEPEPVEPTPEIVVYTEAPMAYGVNDNMGFDEAFAAARGEIGPGGFFEWRGTTYNTYYGEELNAMSPEELIAYQESLQSYIVNQPVEEYQYEAADLAENPPMDPMPDAPFPEEPAIEPTADEVAGQDTPEEMIAIDFNEDGINESTAVNVDDDEFIEVIAVDSNADGTPDIFLVDSDDDNTIDLLINDPEQDGIDGTEEIEVLETPEVITLDDLRPEDAAPVDDKPVYESHDDYQAEELNDLEDEELPDFDNDADVSQFT